MKATNINRICCQLRCFLQVKYHLQSPLLHGCLINVERVFFQSANRFFLINHLMIYLNCAHLKKMRVHTELDIFEIDRESDRDLYRNFRTISSLSVILSAGAGAYDHIYIASPHVDKQLCPVTRVQWSFAHYFCLIQARYGKKLNVQKFAICRKIRKHVSTFHSGRGALCAN